MSTKHAGRDESADKSGDIPLNHAQPRGSQRPNAQELKGVSRLVNPRGEDAELGAGEDDPGERSYLGRLLHIADEALHVKRRGNHRKRRRVH
ncbi:MAG TPA: hypothetical protein VJN43_05995 [Bryobacteraceae bacterium]|nr:hypothetical protein [Bryobacteraceae bacterium]